MGLPQLLAVCAAVVVLVALTTWLMGYLAPDHPAILDKLLWAFAVVIVVTAIWRALVTTSIIRPGAI